MKAIIIAAGKGCRMNSHTRDVPKCLLDFNGKTILKMQIDAFNSCGIEHIVVIKGYKKDKINYQGIKYYVNDDYERNNILNSLFYAEEEICDDALISYSDIVFEKSVVQRLLESKADISIAVDIKWREYYKNRKGHTIEEAENVIFDSSQKVLEIGKDISKKNEAQGEFIGMMKLTKKGAEIFKERFHRAKEQFSGRPFIRADRFECAYLTDMLQHLVNSGVEISCVTIKRGWYEIDTSEDYERVRRIFSIT